MDYQAHHVAISVRNADASITFYKQFGFKPVHQLEDDNKSIYQLKLGDFFLEIFAYKQNASKDSLDLAYANNLADIGVKHLALKTNDAKKSLELLKQAGLADDTTSIDDSEQGLEYFFVKDPDGMWVEIIHDTRYH